MENRRILLLALLGVVLFFIYQAWNDDMKAREVVAQATPSPGLAAASTLPIDDGAAPAVGVLAGADGTGDVPSLSAGAAQPVSNASIYLETDVYRGEISLLGGDLRRLSLKAFAASKATPDQPVALLNDRDGYFFVVQSGLAGTGEALVSHLSAFQAPTDHYQLGDADVLEVPLEFQGDGYRVRKTYRFRRGSYEVELEHQLINDRDQPLVASEYSRMQRTPKVVGEEPKFTHTFMGVGLYEQDGNAYKFKKHDFDDIDDESVNLEQTGGWAAMLQHYFVAALIPPSDQNVKLTVKPVSGRGYQLQFVGPAVSVEPAQAQAFTTRLFIGPKLQSGLAQDSDTAGFWDRLGLDGLEHVAPGLDLTVDYGILTPLAKPLFLIMNMFHGWVANWGLAIILVTLLVKAAFYKLSEAQYRSMAKMRKYAPRIQEIKERFEGDRERQSKAMMDLYKKEGFNPLAGCWPLLVQMPVFFALYWVLLESVELRQADFLLWINDLSAPDPWYVLPVLFAGSMWFQQRMSGQTMTMDPLQQRIMGAMPIAMGGFFAFFPAGLVLYWVVSNVIGIAQQLLINRRLDREGLGKQAAV